MKVATKLWKERTAVAVISLITAISITFIYGRVGSQYLVEIYHMDDSEHDVTSLDDVYITVKTTAKFHNTRIDLILKTW